MEKILIQLIMQGSTRILRVEGRVLIRQFQSRQDYLPGLFLYLLHPRDKIVCKDR